MRLRQSLLLPGVFLSFASATPAFAEMGPRTQLVSCGEESCLQISGYREDPAYAVRVNGQEVSAEGKNRWRVHLPIETLRQISAPQARSIEISLRDPQTSHEISTSASLPIGLLGGITTRISLEVSAF